MFTLNSYESLFVLFNPCVHCIQPVIDLCAIILRFIYGQKTVFIEDHPINKFSVVNVMK